MAHVLTADIVLTFGGDIQGPDDIHQCRLSGTGLSDDGHELALIDVQGNAVVRPNLLGAHLVDLVNVPELQERLLALMPGRNVEGRVSCLGSGLRETFDLVIALRLRILFILRLIKSTCTCRCRCCFRGFRRRLHSLCRNLCHRLLRLCFRPGFPGQSLCFILFHALPPWLSPWDRRHHRRERHRLRRGRRPCRHCLRRGHPCRPSSCRCCHWTQWTGSHKRYRQRTDCRK